MRILILGGTRYLGRHLVEAALAAGHDLTLFNRGQSGPGLFPDVEQLRGDRDGDLAALEGRRWDAVVDTSGYVPRIVRASTQLLADMTDHYTFISSISVYRDFAESGIDETYPVAILEDETVEEVSGETYGALKALCEQEVQRALPGRTLILRPGLIVGPHEPTDRFTYWPHRVAQGGEVLAPNGPDLATQVIDARDLAKWNLRLIESQDAPRAGVYNATGPAAPLGLGQVLDACQMASGSDTTITWVSEDFLLKQDVKYWQDLPAVVPEGDPKLAGMRRVDVSKAVMAGLTFRPIAQTVQDTLAWDHARPPNVPLKAGLTREREAALLALWRQREVSTIARG